MGKLTLCLGECYSSVGDYCYTHSITAWLLLQCAFLVMERLGKHLLIFPINGRLGPSPVLAALPVILTCFGGAAVGALCACAHSGDLVVLWTGGLGHSPWV